MLHEYRVVYSVRYYPRFPVTVLGIGTYYPRIRKSTCNFIVMNWATCAVAIQNQLKYCVCEIRRIPWAGDPPITKHRVCSYVFFSYRGWGTLAGSDLIFRNREFYVWNSFDETLLLRCLVLPTVSASYDSFRYLTIFFGLSRYNDSLQAGRGSNPGGGETFRTRPDRSWGPPNLLYNGYRVFPGDKAAGAWRWPPTPTERRG